MTNLIELNDLAAVVQARRESMAAGDAKPYDTAVILHLYYTELWEEIRGYLANLGEHFDLYVTVCETATDADIVCIRRHYPEALICQLINQGRDIGPFVEIYPLIAAHYRYICKIHSKRSPHLLAGDVWRRGLYEKLLNSPREIAEIKAVFDRFPEIGIIGPAGHVVPCHFNLGENAERVREIMHRLGIKNRDDFDYDFPAGSMFWFRPAALAHLQGLSIRQKDFEQEQGQLDGTLAHAFERVLPLVCELAGYETTDTRMLEVLRDVYGENWSGSAFTLDDKSAKSVALRLAKYESRAKILARLVEENSEMITTIYSSTSWRITYPLRALAKLLK
jgi:lipopolysaccharide biosynthesis protein